MSKIREFRRADEEALLDWLCAEIFHHEHHPERLRELIRAECRTRGIEAPADIAGLIETGSMAYEAQIYTVIVARLAPEVHKRLDALLVAEPVVEGEEEEELPLSLLRLDPGPVGVESALSEIAKLRPLRAIGLPPDLFQGLLTVDEHLFLCYTFLMFDATFDASLACMIRSETRIVYRSRSAATVARNRPSGLPT